MTSTVHIGLTDQSPVTAELTTTTSETHQTPIPPIKQFKQLHTSLSYNNTLGTLNPTQNNIPRPPQDTRITYEKTAQLPTRPKHPPTIPHPRFHLNLINTHSITQKPINPRIDTQPMPLPPDAIPNPCNRQPQALPYQKQPQPEPTTQEQNAATEHFSYIYLDLYEQAIRVVGTFSRGITPSYNPRPTQIQNPPRDQHPAHN